MSTRLTAPESSLATLSTREWSICREMTTRSIALGAARLMLQQHLWGRRPATGYPEAQMSVFESLCLASGGHYSEDGRLSPPDEPEAATLLARTCRTLTERCTGGPLPTEDAGFEFLNGMRAISSEDHIRIQKLLAAVHGPADGG